MIGKKNCKENGSGVIYGGPRLKIAFFMENIPKKGCEFKSHEKEIRRYEKMEPHREKLANLSKFKQRSPAETVFTYRIS